MKNSTQDQQKYMLLVRDLHYKSAAGKEILNGINLRVKKGEFVGIIGPNGAGKTTLLKCINRINSFTGSVIIDGTDVEAADRKTIALKTSLMHQNTAVTFPFTAGEIVLMGRYPHFKRGRSESSKDHRIVKKYMKYTGTENLADQTITSMSGGESQKVMFAKALAQEADLVLLDEPTASLDIAYEEQLFKIASNLCKNGTTVIVAVHDLKIAARFCSRLILMKSGRIIADGPAEKVLTSENLSSAYGVNAVVYRNRITGNLDYHIFNVEKTYGVKKVHIIGGGGSASGIMRYLFEKGYKITAGVLSRGDSDFRLAELLGINCVTSSPFSEIDEDSFKKNLEMVSQSDITILCDMPFGLQNLKNIEVARHAKRLVLIEDDDIRGRDYTGGKGLELYSVLRENAEIISISQLYEVL
ncbi:MAG: ABC transporter ATP-binding protein [Eubacteriales bacterium]|nr:ABC transporter ATP-binding protein [Eubacteriales bacterium]